MADGDEGKGPTEGLGDRSDAGSGNDDIQDLVRGLDTKRKRSGSSVGRKIGYVLAIIGVGSAFVGGMYAKDVVIDTIASGRDTIVETAKEVNEWGYERLYTTPTERAIDFRISLDAYSHKLPGYEAAIFSVVDKAATVSTPAQLESLTKTTFDKMSPEQQKAFAGAVYKEVGLKCECK